MALGKVGDAKKTAAWLMSVSSQDGKGGLYWHDYIDDNNTSKDVYTSFDDGTIGIGDFFWQLYEKTNDPQYKQVYIEGLNWTVSQAEPYSKDGLSGYRWKWNVTDPNSPYYMGMGEGAAGITYALADGYQRLQHSDPDVANRCKKYMNGSLAFIESVRQELAKNIGSGPAIPETGVVGQDGDTELDSGYLHGAAGDAFMYMHLYEIFHDKQDFDHATELLDYLSDDQHGPMVKVSNNAVTWRLALDPRGGNNNRYATGFEEGNAGIGWVFLQAYKLTGNNTYLQLAERAGNWLINVAVKGQDSSLTWHENENPVNPLVHANLNNGAAGIGVFMRDLYLANGKQSYQTAAKGAYKGIVSSAKFKAGDIYWQDNGGNDPYSNDPSWHWGLSGIAEFAQRLNGGLQDIPGEQPALR
ncbi:MAG TPA: lanthionine synthetase LanC family protein [Candidatus Saccharimonadales bacterium]|nr:lanthionine synthetase LanC family protein [Candidatus Saccharimonadales bacterium]